MAPKKQSGYSKPSDEGEKSPTQSQEVEIDIVEQMVLAEDLASMMPGSSTDTLEDCMNRLKELTLETVKKYKLVKSEVKKHTKELNAATREQRTKEKLEEKKELKRQKRQERIKLFINILGKNIIVMTTGGTTLGQLREDIVSAVGIAKLVFNGVSISSSPRMTLIKAGLRNGDTITASFEGDDNTQTDEGGNFNDEEAVGNLLDEDEDEDGETSAAEADDK
eukprot:symbB.v1.2.033626.t1/scaffold4206.1/size45245/2